MPISRARRGETGLNYWPGFVDALSTLILSIIFLLSVFVVVQFYLQQEVQGQNNALQRLNVQVSSLSDLLSMEKASTAAAESQVSALQANLAKSQSDLAKSQSDLAKSQDDSNKYKSLYEGAATDASTAQGKLNDVSGQLSNEKDLTAKTLAQVDTLNQQIAALRQQLTALNSALNVSQKKDQESQQQLQDSQQRISDLGQKLNLALAKDVQQLSNYRSDFFGKLREILGNRPDIRIVGDRFVLQSEIFFDTGRADLKPEGSAELDKVAAAVAELETQIPADIPWILRVDGHTDVRPVSGGQFKSNWDLSAARAIAVVKYLISKGVKPNRLVAAGFGEFEPIDTGATEDAYRRNRRIEFKLTDR